MDCIGLSQAEKADLFRVVAAVLHLSNVQFEENTKDKKGEGRREESERGERVRAGGRRVRVGEGEEEMEDGEGEGGRGGGRERGREGEREGRCVDRQME